MTDTSNLKEGLLNNQDKQCDQGNQISAPPAYNLDAYPILDDINETKVLVVSHLNSIIENKILKHENITNTSCMTSNDSYNLGCCQDILINGNFNYQIFQVDNLQNKYIIQYPGSYGPKQQIMDISKNDTVKITPTIVSWHCMYCVPFCCLTVPCYGKSKVDIELSLKKYYSSKIPNIDLTKHQRKK